MSFKEKIKGFFDNISKKTSIRTTAIEHVININNQYINTELKLINDSQDGIIALKNYADTESLELENSISALKLTFKGLESLKKEKIEKLKKEFIFPLQEILEGYNNLKVKLIEADKAEKTAERLQLKYDKKKDKKTAIDIDETKFLLREAQDKYEILRTDVENMTETLNQEKIKKLLSILKGRIDIEKSYCVEALESIKSVIERYDVLESFSQE